ncbi:MAG: hypothetical protein J2P16_07000, partial [Mycobacterium sp.]|nr:hypothetical protein [Mycobacterium sp.]
MTAGRFVKRRPAAPGFAALAIAAWIALVLAAALAVAGCASTRTGHRSPELVVGSHPDSGSALL